MAEKTAKQSTLLTPHDVAKMCGVSTKTIANWEEKELIPAGIRISPRSVRWREEVVLAWIRQGCPPASDFSELL
ncbi:helix-turn-helix transcriptional regulator [Thalassoglobus neptunius]|uniref:helix-turn-helix transcriptional regulator n=1 Tax=Thalassoglobus neptunius TaxID=1938619 RepID=UPI0018D25DE3|nr:helix-turn-helix domain-containing protein [Thalassoglobus neptunius]